MQTVKSGYLKPARGTTACEACDEICTWLPIAKDLAATNGHKLFVSWDNPSIHPNTSEVAYVGLAAESFLKLPARSPDLHQLVEHANSSVKRGIVRACHKQGWDNLEPEMIFDMIPGVCASVSAQSILDDLSNLIDCYKVVSTDAGQHVEGMPAWVKGTGGGYPPHPFC
jgi:hypothetical protein